MKMQGLSRVAAAVAMTGAAFALSAAPASASTLGGTATITDPALNPLASGGSATLFSVALPAEAACSGDTANDGYHVFSYLVQKGTTITGITFTSHPSEGVGIVNNTGEYYGPANTAITTGQIISIPTNFEWAPLVTTDGLALASLLYNGGASGVWEAGLACANSSGTLTDYWNTEVTFTASQSDANGFVWAAVPGVPAQTPEVPWAGVLPVAGAAILGGGLWFSRRRSSRKVALIGETAGT